MRPYAFLLCLPLFSCVTVHKLEITPVDPEHGSEAPVTIVSPVKMHLRDGSTVMYPKGVVVSGDKVTGQGFKYDLTLASSTPVTEIAIDDVAAMESFQTPVNTGATAAASGAATVGGGVGGVFLVKAIFGSCPTTYSLDSGEPVLEAESFSYSIAPGFEMRDIDRLGIDAGDRAFIALEMRNEALETHYIDHVELLEVVHASDETVYPDHKGRPVVVGQPVAATRASDRSGRDISKVTGMPDDDAWSSDAERLFNIAADDMDDFVEFEFPVSSAQQEYALVLRGRNSLLNTVLLYDVMLQGQGVRAIDWMGDELTRLGPRYRLAKWYRQNMGMRVRVHDGRRYREVASVPDTGPIAWKDLAIPLPRGKATTIRIRLEFLTDNWRIDQVAVAPMIRTSHARPVSVASVTSADGHDLARARDYLDGADDQYVITRPGEYLQLRFDIGRRQEGWQRTYFLAAEGYYIEWVRADWLKSRRDSVFEPGDEALLSALVAWREKRDAFTEQFDATRIPVR